MAKRKKDSSAQPELKIELPSDGEGVHTTKPIETDANGKPKGNAAISDTLGKNGKILNQGLDTTKLYNLINSPQMRDISPEPFHGKNSIRKIPVRWPEFRPGRARFRPWQQL